MTARKRRWLFPVVAMVAVASVLLLWRYRESLWQAASPMQVTRDNILLVMRAFCPYRHRIQLLRPPNTLYVDVSLPTHLHLSSPEWPQEVRDVQRNGGCPISPLVADVGFEFVRRPRLPAGYDTPSIPDVFVDRHLPLRIRFQLSHSERQSSIVPLWSHSPTPLPGGGTVDDITERWFNAAPLTARIYILQHPTDANGFQPRPFLMECGGVPREDGPGRRCRARYVLEPDLPVAYEFRQDRHDAPHLRWPTADGTIAEPEGLLEIDARVRAFVEDVRRRR